MAAAGHPNIGHLPEIEYVLDLIRRQYLLAADQVADQHVLLDRLLAQVCGLRVADAKASAFFL